MMRVAFAGAAVAVATLVGGVFSALRVPEVYSPPDDFRIERRGVDGFDRVVIFATVRKHLDCDVERGGGPSWVEFRDESGDVPPISALFRPDGSQAGHNRARAGQEFTLDGYTATIPSRMAAFAGTFTVRVPCVLWTLDEAGNRHYDREIVASWGPLPIPARGSVVEGAGGGRWRFVAGRIRP